MVPLLLEASNLPPTQPPPPPEPSQQENYPNIRFWTCAAYKAFESRDKTISSSNSSIRSRRGNTSLLQGSNISMLYVEDENRQPVNGQKAAWIRYVAFSIFHQLKRAGLAPRSWGAACNEATKLYILEIEQQVCATMSL